MAEDARVRKTKQKLSAALVGLLQEKAFGDITPAQICEKAGINRSTFYRNYKNTTQLKNELESRILAGVAWNEKLESPAQCQKCILEQLNYLCEHRDTFMALSSAGFREDIFDKIRDQAISLALANYSRYQTHISQNDYNNRSTFCVCGVVELIRSWFMGGMIQNPEVLAEFLASKVSETVRSFNGE